jgi:hypothetical protein
MAEEFKDESGFFYIIKCADVPDNVYKIGKTCEKDPNKRLCRYPPFSCVQYTIAVANADLFEDIVMRKFKSAFTRRREFGLEYYEGDIIAIIDEVHRLWLKYGRLVDAKLDKTIEKIKPNGWQYFVNDWLSKNPTCDIHEAYEAYVKIMKDTFASNEYAEFEPFAIYYESTVSV